MGPLPFPKVHTTSTLNIPLEYLRYPVGQKPARPFSLITRIAASTEFGNSSTTSSFRDQNTGDSIVTPPLRFQRLSVAVTYALYESYPGFGTIRIYETSLLSKTEGYQDLVPENQRLPEEVVEQHNIAIATFSAYVFPNNFPLINIDDELVRYFEGFRANYPNDFARAELLLTALEARCPVLSSFTSEARSFLANWITHHT